MWALAWVLNFLCRDSSRKNIVCHGNGLASISAKISGHFSLADSSCYKVVCTAAGSVVVCHDIAVAIRDQRRSLWLLLSANQGAHSVMGPFLHLLQLLLFCSFLTIFTLYRRPRGRNHWAAKFPLFLSVRCSVYLKRHADDHWAVEKLAEGRRPKGSVSQILSVVCVNEWSFV